MPWKGVTVSEQRQRFLEDYQLSYYSVSELAERFSISRKTAHKWINRFKKHGQAGFHELSRRPHSCPWQTDAAIAEELVELRKAHPHWGPRKLFDLMHRRDPERELPAVSTAAQILSREGLIKPPGLLGQAGAAIGGRTRGAPRASRRAPTISACTCGVSTGGPRTTRGSSA